MGEYALKGSSSPSLAIHLPTQSPFQPLIHPSTHPSIHLRLQALSSPRCLLSARHSTLPTTGSFPPFLTHRHPVCPTCTSYLFSLILMRFVREWTFSVPPPHPTLTLKRRHTQPPRASCICQAGTFRASLRPPLLTVHFLLGTLLATTLALRV